MIIKLTTPISVLGKKGQTVKVGRPLGAGLIRRGQAVPVLVKSLDDMTVKELQEEAKAKGIPYGGKNKETLLKELKDGVHTKEEKSDYATK